MGSNPYVNRFLDLIYLLSPFDFLFQPLTCHGCAWPCIRSIVLLPRFGSNYTAYSPELPETNLKAFAKSTRLEAVDNRVRVIRMRTMVATTMITAIGEILALTMPTQRPINLLIRWVAKASENRKEYGLQWQN
jgi:hypothetical protein